VPVDGSPQCRIALQYALGLPDADITLLATIDPFDTAPEKFGYQSPIGRAGMPGYGPESYEPVKAEARARFAEAQEIADADGVGLPTAIEFGPPARTIVRYAEEEGIDHIVVGNRRRSWPSRTILASTAERVVRRANVPVTVVGDGRRTSVGESPSVERETGSG
jgi:nucleotide-binding universal stress UspA family protein